MNCPKCRTELKESKHKGVSIHRCGHCEGFWFEGNEFREALEKEDRFLHWADIDLWKNDPDHSLKNRTESCPDCTDYLFEVQYKGTNIRPWVCIACRGVWIEKKEFKKILKYLEQQLDSQTIKDFIKHLGKEAAGVLSHENLAEQFKDMGMVLKLIGYRLASKFSLIEKLSRNLPKP